MVGTFTVGGGVKGNVAVPSKITPAQARGHLKMKGSTDPDILAMAREELLEETRQKRLYAWVLLVMGIVLIPTIIGIALSVVFIPMGLWGLSRGKQNTQVVDAAIEEVSRAVASPPQTA